MPVKSALLGCGLATGLVGAALRLTLLLHGIVLAAGFNFFLFGCSRELDDGRE
jgi:hypothetical protein